MALEHINQVKGLVSRPRLRELMRRTDYHAWRSVSSHLGWITATGTLVYLALGTLWLVPAMVLHGVGIVHLFSAQHEFAHRTAFRTRRLNDLFGWIFGAAIMLPHVYFRWEHTAHHTYTQDTKRDPELIPQPSSLAGYFLYLSTLPYWWGFLRPFCRHLFGMTTSAENAFLPATERWKVIWEARAMLAIYFALALIGYAFDMTSLLYFWLLPRFLAEPCMRFVRMSEHVGRPVNNTNLLQNTRTMQVAAPLRWLAWNMPYHGEHHLAPSVPFHGLAALHREIARYHPSITRGYWGAHKDIFLRSLRGSGPALALDWPQTRGARR